ncbi:hypothetical protein GCM10011594_27480 [Nakamurella endophytica]|uniref:Uncharacterized protein n=2 Tax=Nakamurella endophytica TaxID=1748367 RepID=A0A917WI48_9ACTN|nr:hypothetical protein GCM10011594_27480 [Nakamurella endophytica]
MLGAPAAPKMNVPSVSPPPPPLLVADPEEPVAAPPDDVDPPDDGAAPVSAELVAPVAPVAAPPVWLEDDELLFWSRLELAQAASVTATAAARPAWSALERVRPYLNLHRPFA